VKDDNPGACPRGHEAPRWCAHEAGCHDGTEPSQATAPPTGQAWLLIEHHGPWPRQPQDAVLPEPVRDVAVTAAALGIRLQLIRRPGRREGRSRPAAGTVLAYLCCTAAPGPWLRRGAITPSTPLPAPDLGRLSQGQVPAFGTPAPGPLILICTHGHRNVCCALFGGPLARALASQNDQVWETTHVGGDRHAANLVILPHGLYYGPVTLPAAQAAITAYQRGEVVLDRYRGRAGQPHATQAAQHSVMLRTGTRAIPPQLPR
jgi:hypothetical protein